MSSKETPAIILVGSQNTRCQILNGEHCVIPTVVGLPNFQAIQTPGDEYLGLIKIGNAALNLQGVMKIKYPVEWGSIVYWDAFKEFIKYTYYDFIQKRPQDQPLLISPPKASDEEDVALLAETLFENYGIKQLSIIPSSILVLSAVGKRTGLIVDMGLNSTLISAIHDSKIIPESIILIKLGGRDITQFLLKSKNMTSPNVYSYYHFQVINEYKEQYCFVSTNLKKELLINRLHEFMQEADISSGFVVSYGIERFIAPEILFDPKSIGSQELSLQDGIQTAIENCPTEVQEQLYQNIILTGGNSMIPHLQDRLEMELTEQLEGRYKLKIYAQHDRKHLDWSGVEAVIKTDDILWVTPEDYRRVGVEVFFTKYYK